MKLEKVPLLVFWESTKACPLLCRHCRANAILKPLPDELNTKEAKLLINQISEFENPKPVFIITGGDPLMRKDLFELIEYARSLGIAVGLSPAVSENLNEKVLLKLKNLGVKIISVSLDGASKETHEYLRQVNGIYEMTINAIKMLVDFGFQVQVNTLIWKGNLNELPYLVKLLLDLNVRIWEVFFLIITGRAGKELDIEINEYEDVVQFLVDVSRYSIQIRTVEAPFYRRAKLERLKGKNYSSDLYCKLIEKLKELL
ncbi:MAG: radical SAM protein, partial [candidate division WOR-3 bacterium]